MGWRDPTFDKKARSARKTPVNPDAHRPDVLPDGRHACDLHAFESRKRRLGTVGELYKRFPGRKRVDGRSEKRLLALLRFTHDRKTGDDRAHASRVGAEESREGERVALDDSRTRERSPEQSDKFLIALDQDEVLFGDAARADGARDRARSRTEFEHDAAGLCIDLFGDPRREPAARWNRGRDSPWPGQESLQEGQVVRWGTRAHSGITAAITTET